MTIDCLDHGFVRLVEHVGSDLSIIRAARVSYNADWRTGVDAGKDEKLIGYLLKNHHTSPFETVTFTFEVKAPIFIFRQWHRHRTWSYNEISARYTELDEGFYIPNPAHVGRQSLANKQARDINESDESVIMRARDSVDVMRESFNECHRTYKLLLERGIPRELARTVLPVAAYSRMFATVDLHNLMHFLRLRLHPHAQYEIRVYAEAILELIKEAVPVTAAAFEESLHVEA